MKTNVFAQFPGSSTVEHSAVNRRVASSNLARGATFLRFCFQRLPPIPHVRFELKPKSRKLSLNVSVKSACEDCKNETRRSVSALDFCGRMHIVLCVFIRR